MEYVIIDLEWDSAYSKPHKRFINQIIQIGAVKLDDKLNIIDMFERTIKSSITNKLSKRFTDLTGITNEQMLNGVSLFDAFSDYNNWVSKDTLTLSWSNSDLYAIIDNVKTLMPDYFSLKIEKYMDLQSYVQSKLREKGFDITSQVSLSNAAIMLNVSEEGLDRHTAKDDCILSAILFKKVFDGKIQSFVRDTSNPDFFKRLTFKSYYLTNIKNDLIKPEDLVFKCDKCGETAKCLTRFKHKNTWFFANFRCTKCKRNFIGRVSFKKTFDKVIVRKKIIELKAVQSDNGNNLQRMSEKMQRKENS